MDDSADQPPQHGQGQPQDRAVSGPRRLYREPEEKKIAGVCGGLADYTGVDPGWVRAAAIVLAVLTPFGLIGYLVAVFAVDQRPPSVPRVTAPPVEAFERHRWLPVALLVALVVVGIDGSWWWWFDAPVAAVVLIGIGAWLLVRSRQGEPPGDSPTPPPGQPGSFDPSTERPPIVTDTPTQTSWSTDRDADSLSLGVDITTRNEDADPRVDRTADLRDAVDGAGAGDVDSIETDPGSPAHGQTGSPPVDQGAGPPGGFPPLTPPEWSGPEVPGPRPDRLGMVVLALLLVGGGSAWFVAATDIAEVDPRGALAAGLVVVGAALVVAAWRGRARATLLPVALVTVAVLVAGEVIDVPFDAGVGERNVRVERRGELREPFELLMGELDIDLRDAPLSATRPTRVTAEVGAGQLRIRVPAEANVVVHATVQVGSVAGALRTPEGGDGGFLIDETYVLEGEEGRPDLELVLGAGIGEVEVLRD